MWNSDVFLLFFSVVAQFAAAFLAIRLGRQIGRPIGGVLLAAAAFLMGIRRSVTLYRVIADPSITPDRVAEGIALGISILILAGLAGLAPYFRTARAAREQATALGKILEDSLNEIYLFDAETLRFVQVNRGARENLGYTIEELRSRTPLDIKPEFTPEEFAEVVAPLRLEAKDRIQFPTLHQRKDGSTYPVEVHLQLSRMDDQPVFAAIILDVTERRRAGEARRRLEEAAERAGEGITILDHEGRIEYANLAFAQMMQRPRKAILGSPIDALAFGDSDVALLTDMRAKLSQGDTWRGRYESVWPDGSRHTRHATVTPLQDGQHTRRGYVGVIRDTTHEAQLEQELYQSQKMDALGQLAGGVAHDFNNLLTVIGIYSEALIKDTTGNNREAALGVSRATERASAITRQLLTFSRKDRDTPQVIDLNALLAGMHEFLRRLIGEDVLINLRGGPDVGRVRADSGRIEQVIMNLAINARDAMPRGGTLEFATYEVERGLGTTDAPVDLPAGRYVVISVSDSGAGMDEETQRRIFEPFFTTKEPGKGIGLGLSTAYGIVKAAGGSIRVESAPGLGCTFEIYLPSVQAEGADADHGAPSAGQRNPCPAAILLVEDEPSLRDLARDILESAGHRVTVAADGREALALATGGAEPVDLLVTDAVMPHMSGFALTKNLRERFPELRVLIISGYPDRTGEFNFAGHDAFLGKPFRPDDLLCAVADVLDGDVGRAPSEARASGSLRDEHL